MDRCPQCHRFGIEYDPGLSKERCLWKDCLWVNYEGVDLSKHDYGINFQKFIDSIGGENGV